MYKEFFGFLKEPFSITPDTELFYCSKNHEEVLEIIEYQLEKRRGFIVLTGDVGTGKTSVCRILLNKLPGYYTSLVLNPFLKAKDIIYYICQDFGIISRETDANEGELFHLLTEFFIKVDKENKNSLIIVDEAQNLSFEAFEMIRHISNIEFEDKKLVQILFVGQPELLDKINSNKLRQLRQRVSIVVELKPLSLSDTINYINFRVQETLKYKKFIFTESALKRIYFYTKGYPREIHQIAELSLIAAYNNGHKKVTKSDVDKAAKEYYKKIVPIKLNHNNRYLILFFIIFILSCFLFFFYFKDIVDNNFIISKNSKPITPIKPENITLKKPPNISPKINKVSPNGSIIIDNNSKSKKNVYPEAMDLSVELKIKSTPKDNLSIDEAYSNSVNDIDNNSKVAQINTKKDNISRVYYNVFLGPLERQNFFKKIKILKKHKVDFFTKKIDGNYYIFLGYLKHEKSVKNLRMILKKINCLDNFNVKKEIKK